MMKYPHPETHKLEVWCYQEGWNAAIDRILNMEEVKIYELDMTIEKIRQLYREALELSFVKDPLGFALYSVWREREDRKEECTESQP